MRTNTSPSKQPGRSPFAAPGLPGKQYESDQISKLDRKHHRIKLSNGKWFIAPPAVDITALRIGEVVEVEYELARHHYYASSIKPV